MTLIVRAYLPEDFLGVDRLWTEVFPDDPPYNRAAVAIPAKLALHPELFLVAADECEVVGTVMAGYDGHRGWLYAIAVRTSRRRAAIGSALIAEAEARLKALGCGKINLQIRSENEAVEGFYKALGYEPEPRVSMAKRI
jgi:ribosomal protein S18 acetylase RimI-like enzyme